MTAAFLVAAPALWLTKASLPGVVPADAAARPFVVVPSSLADEPKVAEIRGAGARLYLSFSVYAPPADERKVPLSWYAQAVYSAAHPAPRTGALTLEDDGALAYQTARARALGARTAEYAGLVLSVDMAANATFRYAAADRDRAIAATGLDPVDFDDPVEPIPEGVGRTAQPKALVEFLRRTGHDRARRVALAIAAPFAARGEPIALRVDPALALADAGAARHVTACGDWTTMLDLPGLVAAWAPASALPSAGAIRRALGGLPLGFYGAAKDLPTDGPRIETP